LYAGNYSGARTILSGYDPGDLNTVENNYYAFYQLYANYLEAVDEESEYTDNDAEDLYDLAGQCPGTDGAVIYQARALYNAIYGIMDNYDDCEDRPGARMALENNTQLNGKGALKWAANVYPNPAANKLSISTNAETESLRIIIFDLSSRVILDKEIKINQFIVNLELNLLNGAYIINFINSNNEKISRKLLIAK
jgi:hypothetical protein